LSVLVRVKVGKQLQPSLVCQKQLLACGQNKWGRESKLHIGHEDREEKLGNGGINYVLETNKCTVNEKNQ
jgi:hypothetical protein